MAIVVPMRKKYKPRHIVESVVDNVLRLRSNCQKMTNPNTKAQQYVRSRFKCMQQLHGELAPLFKRGFDRRLNERERWVGAYHRALGHNMVEAARYNSQQAQWYCHFAGFALAEHKSRAPKRITVQREGHILILSYQWKGRAERTSILWAVYNRKRNQWVQGIKDTRLNGKTTACALPPAWHDAPLEVLIGFGRDAEGRGSLRGTHHFTLVKSVGTVTVRGGKQPVQGSGTQGNQSMVNNAVTVYTVLPLGRHSWVALTDAQGVTLRVPLYYLRC